MAPSIDVDYVRRLEATLESNTRVMNELMGRIGNTTPAPRSEPEIDPEKEKQEYFENPAAFTRKIVNDALKQQVAPLNEFVSTVRASSTIDELIAEVKNNPQVKSQFTSAVERAARLQLASVPAASLNKAVVQHAIVNAIGLKAMGHIKDEEPAPQPNPQPSNNPVPNPPPNVRPTNPAAPTNAPRNPEPQLTENERRLAREQGMTPKEFVFYRDMPPDKVTSAKWDKATQTGTY